MMPPVTTTGGNTPLSPEELADLIPSLATKEELNEWERENILIAREWATGDRTSPTDMVSDEYVRIAPENVRPDMEVGRAVPTNREKHRDSLP